MNLRRKREVHWILRCGKNQRKENLNGKVRGEAADPAGILSVPQCVCITWERLLTFMVEEKTSSSLTTKMRLLNRRRSPEKHLQDTGCTMHS